MLEQEYRSLQRLMEIAELRQKGIQDTHLLDWNFRVAEDTPYVQMGKRYINNWQQVKAENLGLLFRVECRFNNWQIFQFQWQVVSL